MTTLTPCDLLAPLRTRGAEHFEIVFTDDMSLEAVAQALAVAAVCSQPFSAPNAFDWAHGPHSFTVATDWPALFEDKGLRGLVADKARALAMGRCDMGRLRAEILSGARWPLPNLTVVSLAEAEQRAVELCYGEESVQA